MFKEGDFVQIDIQAVDDHIGDTSWLDDTIRHSEEVNIVGRVCSCLPYKSYEIVWSKDNLWTNIQPEVYLKLYTGLNILTKEDVL